jgi:hypothetical protein
MVIGTTHFMQYVCWNTIYIVEYIETLDAHIAAIEFYSDEHIDAFVKYTLYGSFWVYTEVVVELTANLEVPDDVGLVIVP